MRLGRVIPRMGRGVKSVLGIYVSDAGLGVKASADSTNPYNRSNHAEASAQCGRHRHPAYPRRPGDLARLIQHGQAGTGECRPGLFVLGDVDAGVPADGLAGLHAVPVDGQAVYRAQPGPRRLANKDEARNRGAAAFVPASTVHGAVELPGAEHEHQAMVLTAGGERKTCSFRHGRGAVEGVANTDTGAGELARLNAGSGGVCARRTGGHRTIRKGLRRERHCGGPHPGGGAGEAYRGTRATGRIRRGGWWNRRRFAAAES